MKFGYARVFAEELGQNAIRERLLEQVVDDRFLFEDVRNREQERKKYAFLRSMLRSGDVLYIDALDSLGSTWTAIAEEWKALTRELQVDVVVLEDTVLLDSRRFRALGEMGKALEEQFLSLLPYVAQMQQRREEDAQRPGEGKRKSHGKAFGRPRLQWDWELFHATAERWANGEISVEEACRITNSARSSWYKYMKEQGYHRTRQPRGMEKI